MQVVKLVTFGYALILLDQEGGVAAQQALGVRGAQGTRRMAWVVCEH